MTFRQSFQTLFSLTRAISLGQEMIHYKANLNYYKIFENRF